MKLSTFRDVEGVLAGSGVVGLEVPSEYPFVVKQWLIKKIQLQCQVHLSKVLELH